MKQVNKKYVEMFDVILLFGVAFGEVLLFIYRSYNNASWVNMLLIGLPILYFVQAYFRYVRYYHMRHIYTEEELKKQNRL